MTTAPHPTNEKERLQALQEYQILDTAPEEAFDDIVQLAAQICGTPISLVSFVDEKRQWFKAKVGLDISETPRDVTFCAHAILQPDPLVVSDASVDDRFSSNPLVVSEPYIRFYAGVPLRTSEGFGLGTLCVIDQTPRHLSTRQVESLRALARKATAQLELRRQMIQMSRLMEQRKVKADKLKKSEARLRDFLDNASDLIQIVSGDGRFQYVNKAWLKTLGYTEQEAKKLSLPEILHPEYRSRSLEIFRRALEGETIDKIEAALIAKDGTRINVEGSVNCRIEEENPRATRSILRDVTERKAWEERLTFLAQHDPLTGLPNRVLFNDRLNQALSRARRNGQRVAVLFLDLDHFKHINDTHGHNIGDLLLKAVAGRLTDRVREQDSVSRVGGDEFALILSDLREPGDAIGVTQAILTAVAKEFECGGIALSISTSIGVSIYPDDGENPDVLLKQADRAMYRPKDQGRNTYTCHSAE